MPSAVQVSAAKNIGRSCPSYSRVSLLNIVTAFIGGSHVQLGGGGVGIGNDANAHLTGIGLGANYVSVEDGYFTQVMGNSVTVGGVRADAHHPSDTRMLNSHISISGNIFYNVSSIYSSTTPILMTYAQDSIISHNDIYIAPYSGICIGYGWGSNDANGSPEYTNRGLYNFQPKYTTPTTSQNNRIDGNLIHGYGLSHTDLGAIYTLSKSPATQITNNYAFDSSGFGLYTDEGSNSYTFTGNIMLSNGIWLAQNGQNTGNNIFKNNFGKNGGARTDNSIVSNLSQVSLEGRKAAYRAGVLPAKRTGRHVSNPDIPDGDVSISAGTKSGTVQIIVNNFDDVAFTAVTYTVSAGGKGLQAVDAPSSVKGNAATVAVFTLGNDKSISAIVKYTNSRTGKSGTLSASKSV